MGEVDTVTVQDDQSGVEGDCGSPKGKPGACGVEEQVTQNEQEQGQSLPCKMLEM